MSEARVELRQLVDLLPGRKIRQARSYLRFLLEEDDENTILLRVAEEDLSDEDRADIAEAKEALVAGKSIPWDEVKKAMGL